MGDSRDRAEAVRRALIEAALVAHEDAGLSGLCAEGRWEAAVAAMRSLEVTASALPRTERPSSASPGESPISGKPVADLIASLSGVVAAVASTSLPPPSGGSVAAAAGALAAALAQMVAGLTTGRPKYAHVAAEMQAAARRAAGLGAELSGLVRHDATAVEAVTAAYKLPKGTEEEASTRAAAIERAIRRATEVPVEIARAAAAVAELAAGVAERGNTNAVADAAVAAFLAESVCRAAALTVRVNAVALHDAQDRLRLMNQASVLGEVAANATTRAVGAVERTQ
jgi:glutamate formiminotransferase/formiminotetrahydrofolate cyclodeaminase